jgi:hypothetical protein
MTADASPALGPAKPAEAADAARRPCGEAKRADARAGD